ncbi:MAG: hypothetical protein RSC68_14780 [Acinetobacter sp.]
MNHSHRISTLLLVLACCVLCLCKCTPEDPFASTKSASVAAWAEQKSESSTETKTPTPATKAPTALAPSIVKTAAPQPSTLTTAKDQTIQSFDVYYDATTAMIGFVDISQAIDSKYMTAIDLLRNKSFFPSAALKIFRVDHTANQMDDLVVNPETISATIGMPSFYASAKLCYEPSSIVLTGESTVRSGRRLNRFIDSFYTTIGQDESYTQLENPAAYALSNISERSISVIVSDLSELNANETALIDQLAKRVFQNDMSFAIIGLQSNFAGFVPLRSSSTVWNQWGSLPSGSPIVTYHYHELKQNGSHGVYYDVPLTAKATDRAMATRPFYILCMGKTSLLTNYVSSLENQLKSRGAECESMIFASDYINRSAGITNVIPSMTDGVNKVKNQKDSYRLGGTIEEADQEKRALSFKLAYLPLSTDPRSSYSASDFTINTQITELDENGHPVKDVVSNDQVHTMINSVSSNGHEITTTFFCPVHSLKNGKYQVRITLSLARPDMSVASSKFDKFYRSEENNAQRFDGSITPGLNTFITDLELLQEQRTINPEIGSFSFMIDVKL